MNHKANNVIKNCTNTYSIKDLTSKNKRPFNHCNRQTYFTFWVSLVCTVENFLMYSRKSSNIDLMYLIQYGYSFNIMALKLRNFLFYFSRRLGIFIEAETF